MKVKTTCLDSRPNIIYITFVGKKKVMSTSIPQRSEMLFTHLSCKDTMIESGGSGLLRVVYWRQAQNHEVSTIRHNNLAGKIQESSETKHGHTQGITRWNNSARSLNQGTNQSGTEEKENSLYTQERDDEDTQMKHRGRDSNQIRQRLPNLKQKMTWTEN